MDKDSYTSNLDAVCASARHGRLGLDYMLAYNFRAIPMNLEDQFHAVGRGPPQRAERVAQDVSRVAAYGIVHPVYVQRGRRRLVVPISSSEQF